MIATPKYKPLAPYTPYDWQLPVLRDKGLIVLLTGSAGGGKSRVAGEKINAYMWKYPGATGLVLRKAREFVNKSAVPFLYHSVMGGAKSGIRMISSSSVFRYPNGSMLWWGGMSDDDQREAVRSIGQEGGLDFVWMEEATAFTEEDFNELLARMRGNAAPWRQIVLSTNPDAPLHWINQRLILGKQAHVYLSRAEDNPANPPDYLQNLALLTGVLHDRLVKGLWVLAEGAIFDNFSTELNITELAEYDAALPVVWFVDDGYARGKGRGDESYHPRVFLLAQYTARGGVNVFAEYYQTQEQPETTIKNVRALGYPEPDIVYVDSSAAQLKGRIANEGLQTIGMTHEVTEGIKNLRRLICDGSGERLFRMHPRCMELAFEFQSYHYTSGLVAVGGERRPAKVNDHGIDAARYGTWRLRYG